MLCKPVFFQRRTFSPPCRNRSRKPRYVVPPPQWSHFASCRVMKTKRRHLSFGNESVAFSFPLLFIDSKGHWFSWICLRTLEKISYIFPQKVPNSKAQGLKNHQKSKTSLVFYSFFALFFLRSIFNGLARRGAPAF